VFSSLRPLRLLSVLCDASAYPLVLHAHQPKLHAFGLKLRVYKSAGWVVVFTFNFAGLTATLHSHELKLL